MQLLNVPFMSDGQTGGYSLVPDEGMLKKEVIFFKLKFSCMTFSRPHVLPKKMRLCDARWEKNWKNWSPAP
jgi:hypothetical protein